MGILLIFSIFLPQILLLTSLLFTIDKQYIYMILSFPLERLDKERILKIAELENVSYVTFLKVYYG